MKEIIAVILIFILGILANIGVKFMIDIKQGDLVCEYIK